MGTNTPNQRKSTGIRLPLWAAGLLAVLLLVILLLGSYWLFKTIQNAVASFEVVDPEFTTAVVEDAPDNEAAAPNAPLNNPPENAAAPIISSDALEPWSGTERVSILLLGIDQRCEEDGPTHTDSIMVLTIDPVGQEASLLSIPRDLWVDIPDFWADRINQANYLGETYEYPGGGPALAMRTVENLLGVPIDYYVAVNFDAFIEAIDLVGGIEIDVPEAIDDPQYPDRCYGYDPFQIEAGQQLLNGEQALKYARTRATLGGDVDRAGRQQAVMLAARDQMIQLDKLPQLIAQAPQLWLTFQKNVRTNMTPDEAVQLALLAQEIPRKNISTAVIDYDYVFPETTQDGRQVLVPVRENIRELRDQIFTPPVVPTPVIENLPALMAEEKARVAVYNGTAVFGLAGETRTYLEENGVNVTEVGNADSAAYNTSQIITYGSFPNTAQYLTQLMRIPPLNISTAQNPEGDFDVLVIIGNDWSVPTP
ncbi:MAG TPA: LytR family transcriptional regulator [Anaerolineae bacterium]|nr:LytR family transcriptional regulator [Anaerolineae bacterium]HIP73891.1 LytR family transcriptional regulator [Anaerolineae bacterium]